MLGSVSALCVCMCFECQEAFEHQECQIVRRCLSIWKRLSVRRCLSIRRCWPVIKSFPGQRISSDRPPLALCRPLIQLCCVFRQVHSYNKENMNRLTTQERTNQILQSAFVDLYMKLFSQCTNKSFDRTPIQFHSFILRFNGMFFQSLH